MKENLTLRSRRFRLPLALLALLVASAALAPNATAGTVVSLTFDDGSAGQYQVRAPLAQRGMRATFFVNSNTIGTFGTGSQARMSWQQVADLAADGNEIGGHTLDHADLTTLNTTQATRQVCDDRQALQARGYNPVSFAYPSGAFNSTVKQIVANCGYTSARAFNEGNPPMQGIETLPPGDRYATKTVISANSTTTLATLQSYVLQAEANPAGNGWVQYVFHRVCGPGCDVFDAVQLNTLTAFIDWLAPRAASGTVVRTVRAALDQSTPPPPPPDTTAPTSTIACNGGQCAATPYSNPVNVSLAASDGGGSGVQAIRYTTDGSTPTATSPTYSAPFTVSQTTTVRYRAWDNAGNAEQVKSQQIQIAESPPPPSGQTVVSLTFDDGSAGQYQVRAPLAQRGMNATFFVNSNTIGTSGTGSQARMSWQQVADLAADGNEIGGHTLDHADLTTLNTNQATRQVCDDRQALQTRGYNPVSFAYPSGAFNSTVKQIVANCGYDSARAFNEGNPPMQGIESLPPGDRYATKTVISANSTTTLATLQSYVLQAEANNSGWVQYVFHRVCGPGCDVFDAVQLNTLTAFMDWLADREGDGTVVRTVREALDQSAPPPPPPPPPPSDETVVSLTFDDGSAGQYQVRAPLAQHGMKATFFVNSNTIGTFGTGSQARMSWQQVADLAADGNEIGGHTLDHADLTTLNTNQATRQVCDDRQALQTRGYNPVSFAYPSGAFNTTTKQIVANCGYTSARAFNEGNPPMQGIETLPPGDRYATKTVISANSTTTLATLQSYVLQAEANNSGWVQYVFHRVCGPGCDVFDAVQLNTLTAFMDWLDARESNGTVVKTVRAALGG